MIKKLWFYYSSLTSLLALTKRLMRGQDNLHARIKWFLFITLNIYGFTQIVFPQYTQHIVEFINIDIIG